jgi:hypothetical protein
MAPHQPIPRVGGSLQAVKSAAEQTRRWSRTNRCGRWDASVVRLVHDGVDDTGTAAGSGVAQNSCGGDGLYADAGRWSQGGHRGTATDGAASPEVASRRRRPRRDRRSLPPQLRPHRANRAAGDLQAAGRVMVRVQVRRSEGANDRFLAVWSEPPEIMRRRRRRHEAALCGSRFVGARSRSLTRRRMVP